MMRRLVSMSSFVVLIVAILTLWPAARAAEEDKGVLADLLSRALSSDATKVSIGSVDGVLSSNASISDIVLSDRDGPWLKVDKVRLVWSRLALLSRRLEVDQLTIGHIQFLRRPLPSETPPPPNSGPGSILPELPVKVIIKRFGVQDLSLGEPVVGVEARLEINGKATLGAPSEGLDLSLSAKRLDAAGEFKAVMTYVPTTDKLTVAVNSDEPAGGIFAHLANLPGLPPVKLALNGAGQLDNFDAKLDFAAGPDVWARGNVTVSRQSAGRKLTLDLHSRLEGMTPAVIRPVFAGETTLKGDLFFDDDSTLATPGLHIVSANARLDIEGGKSADQTVGLKVHAGAIPGATQIGKLDLNASIVGPVLSPVTEVSFEAGEIHTEQGSLDHISANFRAAPNGPVNQETTRIAFEGQGAMSGLKLADPTLGRAIGSEAKLSLRGTASVDRDISFDTLKLTAGDLDARYSGLLGAKKAHGRLEVTARDLSRFAPLAGGVLQGEAHVTADLDGAPSDGALAATIDAQAARVVTAYPALDRVTGGELHLTGAARTTPGGGFGFTDLIVRGAHGSAKLNGDFSHDKANLDAEIDVPQASVLDPRVSGHTQLVATLTGTDGDLGARLKATLSGGRLLGHKTTGLVLDGTASHITGLLEAKADISGDVDGHALQGSVHVVKTADGGWAADNIALSLASVTLAGAVTISADDLAAGELNFSATNLDDLSPLVLVKMTGALQAKISASAADGKQAMAVIASSDRMAFGANQVEGVKVDLKIGDLWGARALSGVAQLVRAELAGQSISAVKLTAASAGDSSDLDLSGTVRGLAVKAHGSLTGGSPIRFDLARFTALGDGRSIVLAGPATLTYGKDGLAIQNFVLRIDSGRLALSGRAGATLDLHATMTAFPLTAFDLVSPGLGLTGTAEGDATIRGTTADPQGDWRIRLRQLTLPQTRANGAPPLDITGSGRLAGGRTSIDLIANVGTRSSLRATGSAPLSTDGALDLKIDGKIDAGLANSTLSPTGRSLTGAIMIAAQLRGTVAKPEAQGSIRIADGEFRDEESGFKLSGISGEIVANGSKIRIDRLTGATPDSGSISVSGEAQLDPAAGFPGTIRVIGKHAQLVSNSIVSATADLALTISGKLAQKPNVDGRVTISSMEVSIPDRFSSVSAPIPGTKHVNPTPTAQARLTQLAKASAARSHAPPFDATLNLTISAPNRNFVRGRGVYTEVGGDLHVAGSASNPHVTGGFDLLRGSLALLGKRLVFTQGRVRFHGDVIPELNFIAETPATDITARIAVTGPANQPSFQISSQPSLPEDEILSRVLFERPSGSLSAFQAIQLANAVAMLAGNGDAFERLRRTLGVDSLDISTNASGGATVGATRAINDRISVGVTTGARPQDNGVNVNLDVTRHLRFQLGADSSGGSSAGIGTEWEFK